MERLLSIGQFAGLSGLSPKAIRLYGDIGILPTASVDEVNGYRRYHPDQLERARLIGLLRMSGVSLSEIGQFLEQPAIEMIERWEQRLEADVQSQRWPAGQRHKPPIRRTRYQCQPRR